MTDPKPGPAETPVRLPATLGELAKMQSKGGGLWHHYVMQCEREPIWRRIDYLEPWSLWKRRQVAKGSP